MNFIVLEGACLYLFLILVLLLFLISLWSLISAVIVDRRNAELGNLLSRANGELMRLIKENFKLKIKCGEFDIDE